jgi:glycosyltransferase involved in cell wall biosynthesis
MPKNSRKLLVLGVHRKSEGYPNVLHRIQGLKECSDLDIHEVNYPIMRDPAEPSRGKRRIFPGLLRAFFGHCYVIIKYLFAPFKQAVYIPYPGIFICAALSIIPKQWRPASITLDQFISIYETVVFDRRLVSQTGIPARILFAIERRALEAADNIIVDTEQSKHYMTELFDITPSKVHAIHLSINEVAYEPRAYQPTPGRCRVLFIGTLIPLHGIQAIAEAINELRDDSCIEFRIIGNGPQAEHLEQLQKSQATNFEWIRKWQNPQQLAQEIAQSDICLGIFGDSAKTDRVCPLKLYSYMLVGRPIITGDTEWSRHTLEQQSEIVFQTVTPDNSKKLAEQIKKLADNPQDRVQLAAASQSYYKDNLTNQDAIKKLTRIIYNGR